MILPLNPIIHGDKATRHAHKDHRDQARDSHLLIVRHDETSFEHDFIIGHLQGFVIGETLSLGGLNMQTLGYLYERSYLMGDDAGN